ncbi:MAG: T9SS type A sorting domain-containing protein [Candidatus Chryseobacterium colombiense]|nr:T9SS type A sorting domain-containing protein [Chryseobacterium sp.]WEK69940.1 MAG: T9SS type A sorting domain-containing protein [Chryseobacterium sp.]
MKKISTFLFAHLAFLSFFSQSWSVQNQVISQNTSFANGISIVNNDNVWAYDSGTPKKYAKTTNGNASWVSGELTDISTYYNSMNISPYGVGLNSFSAADHMNAWVMLQYNDPYMHNDIWKTSNGGLNWQKQFTFSQQNIGGKLVHFFDANTGIALSLNTEGFYPNDKYAIYRTTNGGTNWTPIMNSPNTPGTAAHYYYGLGDALYFWDSRVGGYKIFKTIDRGLSWTEISHTFGGSDWNLTAWSDMSKGIVVEQNPTIFTPMKFLRTTDGGVTWNEFTSTGIPLSWIGDIAYLPGTNILIAVGQDSNISSTQGSWISTDNGNTFTAIDSGIFHRNVRCSTGGVCYSAGHNPSLIKPIMYKMDLSSYLNTGERNFEWEGIFPNPVKDEVNIKTQKGIKTSSLYDISGKLLFKTDQKKIDMSSLLKGVYILKVEFKDGNTVSEKIIKQ